MNNYACQSCGYHYSAKKLGPCPSCGMENTVQIAKNTNANFISKEMQNAESIAWDALSRNDFRQFGYWADVYSQLSRSSHEDDANPFNEIVHFAISKMNE